MASTNYINECKNDAYKNRLGKIEIAEKKVTTGTSIKIEKGADSAIDLTLYGKTTQKNRAGYNILKNSSFSNDLSDWAVLKSGTTPEITTYNGKKCLHFKGSLGSRQHVSQSIEKRISVGKTYTVTCVAFLKDFVAGTTNCFLSFYFDGKKTDGTWTGESIVSGAAAFNSKSYDYSKGAFIKTKYTFKIKEDTDLTKAFGFYIYARDFTGDLYVYDVQIAEGTEAKDWEDFGISPSTEFPSPIESVGRKNLLKNTLVNETKNGITLKVNEDKSIILSGTATKDTPFYFMMPANSLLLKQGTYTLSGNNSNSSNVKLLIHTKDWKLLGNNLIGGTTFTLNENTEVFAYVWVANGTTINTTMYPMLEPGDTKTDYVPYEHTDISATVIGKNIFNKNNLAKSFGVNKSIINTGVRATMTVAGKYKYYAMELGAKDLLDKTITLNATITPSASNVGQIALYFGNETSQSKKIISANKESGTSNIYIPNIFPEDCNRVWILFYGNVAGTGNVGDYVDYSDLMIVVNDTIDNYEEYKSNSLTIDLQGNELCSLPSGTKDEVNITNGKSSIVKRTKEFILDENKTIVLEKALTNTTRFLIYNVTSSMNDYPSAISTHFKYLVDYNSDTEHFYITRNGAMYLFVNKSIASTVDELKTWLSKNNVKFLYELAEPETVNLGTIEMLHTYNGVSNIANSADTEMTVKAYEWTDEITNYDNLQSIQIDSGCYTDGNIIGSVYVECLNASFVAEATNLVDKIIRCQIGVKYADLSTEYICKGKYIIERPNNEITAQMSQITAYSDLYTNLEAIYICNLDYSAGNIALKDVYIDVCKQLGLTPLKTDFLNSTIPITDNPFKNNEKNRVVLQTVSKIACSFVNVYEDNNQIDLCWLSENAEPDYTFEMSDYVSVEGGQVICGPINCLIIKNSQIDDENVTIKDDESIKANGEHSITISDDYILHNAELRQQAITSIWNRVKGLKYVDCKLITYYGKPFLKLGNKIRIYTSDTDYFDTYVLKHKFEYDGAFASTIESPALTEQEIKTKQDISLGKALTNVQIDLDKQKERITSTVTTTNALQDSVSNLSETVQEQANKMQTLSTNLTQTNQSLQAEVNQINESLEKGVSSLKNKLVTIDINGIAVSTSTSAIKAIMNNDRFAIKSGDTEAFYVGYDENLKKSVSRMNDLTITDYFTAGYHRQEKFEIDGEKRTGWFYVGGE